MFGGLGLTAPRSPSANNHDFSRIPRADIPRSSFKRPSTLHTAFDAGFLVPIFLDEVYPGDTFNLRTSGFFRMPSLIFPIMDTVYMDTFFFFVPTRLIWNNWQKFMGEQTDPGDSIDYVIPKVDVSSTSGFNVGTLYDYFGLPTGVDFADVSNLPARAYNLIYNEWFRDQNLQDSVTVDKDDGPDDPANYVLLRRGKRHDYFTSCLPWPQKGDAVTLPLGTTADILRVDNATAWKVYNAGANTFAPTSAIGSEGVGNGNLETTLAGANASLDPDGQIYVDLTTATAATINQLREAFQIQKLYERDARGGTRYTELIRSHFGVVSPDARLQRPEYLGGGSSVINISPIPQTSSTDGVSPQGNLSAVGAGSLSGHGFVKSFTEHGYIIGLVSARANLTYQQGINKLWLRNTKFDFYFPALAHIGEQAVESREIYVDGTADDLLVFGYQERWAELRYKPSQICGIFRSTAAGSLDAWHLSQEFSSRPLLNSTFIVENPPIDRVISLPAQPHFIAMMHFDLTCARPLPMYSVPGLIDHF